MLDNLQLAIRRYEQIAPNPGSEMLQSQVILLTEWLKHDVGRITAELLPKPGFRRRTCWPIRHLTGEVICPEREAVLAVDEALVHYATALREVARSKPIRRQLLRLGPYQGVVAEGDPRALDPSPEEGAVEPVPLGLTKVEFLASRPWRDLASAVDYFHPVAQFNYQESDASKKSDAWQSSCFLPYINRTLRVPGDFVYRCMEIRIAQWRESLDQFFVRCDTARQMAKVKKRKPKLIEARSALNSCINELQRLCRQTPDAHVRDSCIALLQIYVGFHPDVDVSWLGAPAAQLAGNTANIPHRVAHRHEWEIPDRAASALVDISDLVRLPLDPDDLMEEMKATKRFVLVEGQRQGFFEGKPIERDDSDVWHRKRMVWEFLWMLAECAQKGQNVDCHCLSNPTAKKRHEPPTYKAIRDRRADLKRLIVDGLNDLILDEGPGTYRLQLEPDEIGLLGWASEDRLDVLSSSMPRHPIS